MQSTCPVPFLASNNHCGQKLLLVMPPLSSEKGISLCAKERAGVSIPGKSGLDVAAACAKKFSRGNKEGGRF